MSQSSETSETVGGKLSLYHYDGCLFCGLVRNAMDELPLVIELRNILDEPGHLRDLVDATGRRTVPCLRIDSGSDAMWMHESRDIISYLRERASG